MASAENVVTREAGKPFEICFYVHIYINYAFLKSALYWMLQ